MRATYLLLLLFPILTLAQSYTPMAVEGAQWVMYQSAEADSNRTLFGYKIKGDSIVDGKTYKKVFYREYTFDGFPVLPPYLLETEEFHALMRDDIPARKVYAIGASYFDDYIYRCYRNPIHEVEWYDFSKEIGDTLIDQCVYGTPNDGAFVLDSISLDNYYGYDRNTYHGYMEDSNGMRWTITEPHFIEGIGSHRGLFDPAVGSHYLPHEAISLVDYCIGSDSDCRILTSVRRPVVIDHSIFPNPVTYNFFLQLGTDAVYPMSLRIYDLLGKTVMVKEISTSQIEIFTGDWMPGTYTYVLFHKGKAVARAQFFKM